MTTGLEQPGDDWRAAFEAERAARVLLEESLAGTRANQQALAERFDTLMGCMTSFEALGKRLTEALAEVNTLRAGIPRGMAGRLDDVEQALAAFDTAFTARASSAVQTVLRESLDDIYRKLEYLDAGLALLLRDDEESELQEQFNPDGDDDDDDAIAVLDLHDGGAPASPMLDGLLRFMESAHDTPGRPSHG